MNRFIWIDWAKSFMMFCVILGHISDMSVSTFASETAHYFHVPLFFFISGFLYKCNGIINNFKRLILPLLILFIPCVLVQLVIHNFDFSWVFNNAYLHLSFEPWMKGSWFMICLFLCKCCIEILEKHSSILMILILLVLINEIDDLIDFMPNVLYVKQFFSCCPFVLIGILAQKNNTLIKTRYIPIAIISIICAMILNGQCHLYYGYSGKNILLLLCYIYLIYVVLNSLLINKRLKFIETISNGTALILLSHWTVLLIFERLGFIFTSIVFFQQMLIATCVILVYYPLIRLSLRYCPILLGKYRKSNKIL